MKLKLNLQLAYAWIAIATGVAIAASPAASPAPGPRAGSVAPLGATSVAPASAASVASFSPPATVPPERLEAIRQAKVEMAKRFDDRRNEARATLAALRECARQKPDSAVSDAAERAITNLESGLARAEAHAASGVFRKAFLALGRPAQAAAAMLKRCQAAK